MMGVGMGFSLLVGGEEGEGGEKGEGWMRRRGDRSTVAGFDAGKKPKGLKVVWQSICKCGIIITGIQGIINSKRK